MPRVDQRVVFVSLHQGVGGPVRSIGAVLHALSGEVHRTLFAPPGKLFELARCEHWAEDLKLLPVNRRWHKLGRLLAAAHFTLWLTANRRSTLAIHANGESELNIVGLAAALTRTPVVVSARSYRVKPWVKRLAPLWRFLLPQVRWAAVSEGTRQMIVDAGLAPLDRVEVIPNAVDPETIQYLGRPRRTDLPTVGYLGSLTYDKGIDIVVDVVRQLIGEPVRWRIYVGPSGPREDEFKQQVRHNLAKLSGEHLSVVPKVLDVRDAYAECDIVLCPSRQESFGRIVLEAMLNGIPVVASNLPSFAEFLGDDAAGILFDVGDAHAAAEAVSTLLRDPDVRERMGRAGRERAARFHPVVTASSFKRLYGLTSSLRE